MNKSLLYIVLVSMMLLTACNNRNKMPDMRETYGYKQKQPFGTYTAYQMVVDAHPTTDIKIKKRSFSKSFESNYDTSALYISVSRNLYVNPADAQAMLDYVYMGNTLLLSAANIDSILLTVLLADQVKEGAAFSMSTAFMAETEVRLKENITTDSFGYYYRPFINYFSAIKAGYSSVIGYNDKGQPNAFILFWGKGRFILHCDPRALSNYFLLTADNYKYFQNLLAMSGPVTEVYWDDYYNKQNVRRRAPKDFSTLSEFMKYPPLALAFWIFIFCLALFVLFNSKRKQRIIPEAPSNENSSVAFTETIARLYLQHHDNKNIADKMITYFNEHIRKNYFLTVTVNAADHVSTVSRKSGVPLEMTQELFTLMHNISEKTYVSDQELLKLNSHIQEFFKTGIYGR